MNATQYVKEALRTESRPGIKEGEDERQILEEGTK